LNSYGSLTKLPFQYNNRTKQRSLIINPKTYKPFNRIEALKFLFELPDSIIPISDRKIEINNSKNDKIEIFKDNLKIDMILTMCRPCIRDFYYDKVQLCNHDGHDFRVIVAIELINLGISDEVITDYFRVQEDFNELKSMSEIKKIRDKNYKITSCNTILNKCPILLDYKCNLCDYHLGKY